MANELPVLNPGLRVQENPNNGLFPGNLNLGRTPMFGAYGSPSSAPVSMFGSQAPFSAAVTTNAGDYDKIMGMYNDLINTNRSNPVQQINYTPITPQLNTRTGSLSGAISNISNIANSGGLSEGDVSNIRARGVSPIRSIYANAQRNLSRNRALQGGYSPNYGALTAKMAREMSEQVGQANTNVEAGIAELISRNKLSALPTMASLASQEASMENQNNMFNTEAINRAGEQNRLLPLQYAQFNSQNMSDAFNRNLGAVEGMRGLYGTTPALTNMFGNQVLQSQQLSQNAQQNAQQQKAAMAQFAAAIAGQFGRSKG
jgi:hypothetical protein